LSLQYFSKKGDVFPYIRIIAMHKNSENFTAEELRNKKRLLRNTTVQIIGIIVKSATGIAITGILARYLGVKGYGDLSLALVYFSFSGIIAMLGYSAILVREASKIEEGRNRDLNILVSSGIVLRSLSAVVAILCLAIYILPTSYSVELKWQILLMSLVHITGILGIFDFVFRVKLRMEYNVYAAIIYRIVHMLMISLCVGFKTSLTVIIITYLIANALNSGLTYWFSKKFFKFEFLWDFPKIKYIVREAAPLGLAGALWIIYYRIDILMLDWLKGVSSVALYNVAFRFVEYAYMFSSIIMVSIYPLMSVRFPDDPVGLNRIYQKTVDYIAIISGTGSLLLMIFAGPVINLIFGREYDAAVSALRILSLIPLLICMNNIGGHMLLVLGLQGKPLILMRSFGVLINVGLNMLLIPRYDYCGAALATVATELLLLLIVPFIIKEKINFFPSPRNFVVIFPVLLFCLGFIFNVQSMVFRTVIPVFCFMPMVVFLCRYDREELWATFFLRPKE